MRLITRDTRHQNHPQRLGLGTKTPVPWGQEHCCAAQELSGLAWPLRSRVLTRRGYALNQDGDRVPFTPRAKGSERQRQVAQVRRRAAGLLGVRAGGGYRRAAGLLTPRFPGETSPSALPRWREEIAEPVPRAAEILGRLTEQPPLTEAHCEESCPRGTPPCVRGRKDAPGRSRATQAVDPRAEETGKPFRQRRQELGLGCPAFALAGCPAYLNASPAVCGPAATIPSAYCHLSPNAGRPLGQGAGAPRRQLPQRTEEGSPPGAKQKRQVRAQSGGEDRYLLCKADERLRAEEKARLAQRVEADATGGRRRTFLGGGWRILETSQDGQAAREALAAWKRRPGARQKPEQFQKGVQVLADPFVGRTPFLRPPEVKRNALAESGMRGRRRVEVDHDGFRSEKGRENCLRIYQAVKYLGWTVHRSPLEAAKGG